MIGRTWFRTGLAAAALMALAACARHIDTDTPKGAVRMTPDLLMTLPKPSDLGRSLQAAQLVTAHYGDQTIVFEGHISATPEQFLLVGLDPTGKRALTLTWTDQKLTVDTAPGFPDRLRPENMLADIVVQYWPEDRVRQALAGPNVTLTSGSHFRSIAVGGKEVIHVDYRGDDPWNGATVYRNLVWGYELDVQSAESKP